MTRRAARAARADGLRVVGGGVPPELLDPDHDTWRDDAGDLQGRCVASEEIRWALLYLGRRGRHRQAVRAWAVESGWILANGRPDLRRLNEAGLLAYHFHPDYQRALYLVCLPKLGVNVTGLPGVGRPKVGSASIPPAP